MLLWGLTACAGPRMKRLTDNRFPPLPAEEPVDVYVNALEPPLTEIAIIDSRSYAYVDDEVKLKQLEELRAKARRLGANTIQDVRILAKVARGMVLDERTPFTSWKQGVYEMFFMRGTAVLTPEAEPASFDELRPRGGWVVERHETPPPLEAALDMIPMPALRSEQP